MFSEQMSLPNRENDQYFFLFFLNLLKICVEFIHIWMIYVYNWPEYKEDDLNSTDDGEASEETHGASNETQLGLRLDLLVSLDVIKGWRVKANCHKLEG